MGQRGSRATGGAALSLPLPPSLSLFLSLFLSLSLSLSRSPRQPVTKYRARKEPKAAGLKVAGAKRAATCTAAR